VPPATVLCARERAREIEAEEAHHRLPCSARERERKVPCHRPPCSARAREKRREASCVVCVGEGRGEGEGG
jgi:hypothetical protein